MVGDNLLQDIARLPPTASASDRKIPSVALSGRCNIETNYGRNWKVTSLFRLDQTTARKVSAEVKMPTKCFLLHYHHRCRRSTPRKPALPMDSNIFKAGTNIGNFEKQMQLCFKDYKQHKYGKYTETLETDKWHHSYPPHPPPVVVQELEVGTNKPSCKDKSLPGCCL